MSLTGSEIFESVREELLGEAQKSPGLLADLANLERYVAETYSARSFIELLQNADDAQASHFKVIRHGEWLVCANNGREFSRQDFYSLCRSASSAKQRGQTIGYRGIGFKSVVGVASCIHLFSGKLCATFSREITKSCLGIHTPTPLVRIPHPVNIGSDEAVLEVVGRLHNEGYTTVFILGGLDVERVQDEFDQFDADYLLFLRHISEATLTTEKQRQYRCNRRNLANNVTEVCITGPERRSDWHIESFGKCDLAFSLSQNNPVPLNAASAIAHAFLPTLESTGFGIRINADFSTDPSRTRIILDESTLECIDEAAQAIAGKIQQIVLASEVDKDLLACLTPTGDLATLALQKKSFRTELISFTKKKLGDLKNKITLAPTWLNSDDATNLSAGLGHNILVPTIENIEVNSNFMRYLGVKTVSADDIIKAAESVPISPKGCAEVITHCMRNVADHSGIRQLIEKPVWVGKNSPSPTSLRKLIDSESTIDNSILQKASEFGISTNDFGRILKSAGVKANEITVLLPNAVVPENSTQNTSQQIEDKACDNGNIDEKPDSLDPLLPKSASNFSNQQAKIITSRSLPAWRSAEQFVSILLGEHGYEVEDCSRQNLGYDLTAKKGGNQYYIEVKLIDYAGQPFIITTNEETVARTHGASYFIALALRDSNNHVQVQFINNPTETLNFVRQCRQWVWECSEYEFNQPIKSLIS